MFYLILAILSSAMIAIIMRFAQPRVNYPTGLLAGNYITCSILALLLAARELSVASAGSLLFPAGLGIVNGLFYLSSFALMQWNTRHNGVTLSSVFMKLGILVPTVLSVVWFHESPTALQISGFLLAISAIVIIHYQKGQTLTGKSWALLLMLLIGGMGDGMSKVYEVYGDSSLQNTFLFFTFIAALLLCLGFMHRKQELLGIKELGYGTLLGIPNFFSSLFLLKSLDTIAAVIAFPTFSVAVILVVAVAGIFVFHEHLQRRQFIGGILICIALALLNL